jgi:Mg2+ and Co2+ transporter CorA
VTAKGGWRIVSSAQQDFDSSICSADASDHAHDLALGSFELFASRTAESTNNFLKGLTFITLLIDAAGVVAGIFGMNFEVELWKMGGLGFWGVIAGMALVVVGSILYSRNKGWI